MNQKTSKVEKEFYLRCSYLTLSVLFDKEPEKNHFFFWYHHALSFYWLFVFQPFITQVLHVIIVRQRF